MRRARREPEPLISPGLALVTIVGLVFLAIVGFAVWDVCHNGFFALGQD